MFFFNRRRRYNGDVAVLLPAFGIDKEQAGVFELLAVLDVAWYYKYSIYEAALFVAYSYAAGLYDRDVRSGDTFVEEKLKPIQADWIKKDIVRSDLVSTWPAVLEQRRAQVAR